MHVIVIAFFLLAAVGPTVTSAAVGPTVTSAAVGLTVVCRVQRTSELHGPPSSVVVLSFDYFVCTSKANGRLFLIPRNTSDTKTLDALAEHDAQVELLPITDATATRAEREGQRPEWAHPRSLARAFHVERVVGTPSRRSTHRALAHLTRPVPDATAKFPIVGQGQEWWRVGQIVPRTQITLRMVYEDAAGDPSSLSSLPHEIASEVELDAVMWGPVLDPDGSYNSMLTVAQIFNWSSYGACIFSREGSATVSIHTGAIAAARGSRGTYAARVLCSAHSQCTIRWLSWALCPCAVQAGRWPTCTTIVPSRTSGKPWKPRRSRLWCGRTHMP